uniref:Uncharacterized protein n=1 Tax=Zea mays TaxID=4577 RepID=A0A804M556_MAIZE
MNLEGSRFTLQLQQQDGPTHLMKTSLISSKFDSEDNKGTTMDFLRRIGIPIALSNVTLLITWTDSSICSFKVKFTNML